MGGDEGDGAGGEDLELACEAFVCCFGGHREM